MAKEQLLQEGVIFTPLPPPLSPPFKFISLPSLPLPLTSKMAAIIFVMKLLSTRSTKSRLLCRLGASSQLNFLEKVWLFPAESFAKALKSYQSMVLSRACFLILSAH